MLETLFSTCGDSDIQTPLCRHGSISIIFSQLGKSYAEGRVDIYFFVSACIYVRRVAVSQVSAAITVTQ